MRIGSSSHTMDNTSNLLQEHAIQNTATAAQEGRCDNTFQVAGASTERAQAILPTARVHDERLQKHDLTAGDILILVDEANNTNAILRLIKMGQKLPSLSMLRSNRGSPALVHAIMWCKRPNNPSRTPISHGETEIVEMRAGNQLSSSSGPVRQGLYKVYSPTDKTLGDWAAQIGQIWSYDQSIPYSKPLAALSVIRNSNFGSGAETASHKYSKEAFNNRPQITGSFCSHFVIAAYQAAVRQLKISNTRTLDVDARATSVRTLEHFIKSDVENFEFKGYLRINPEDVLNSALG